MPLYLLRQYLFSPSRKFGMKEDVPVNYAGGGGSRYGRKSGGKEKVGTGRNNSRLMIPGVVRRDGVKVSVV